MAISLTQFIKKHLGTKVDFDGYNGPQCTDLARQYYSEVLDVPQFPALGKNGGAKDIIKNPGKLKVIKEDVLADYSSGDVLVWGASKTNEYGHVAILVSIYNTKYFIVLEQDGFKQDGCKLAFRSRENLLGGLYKA
ncbi:MAG: CHAP domain-containing protein [Spirochaetales bacterium]|nr:CHAP domain-containing protein [Spirochaetales bacterium]